MNTVRFIDFFLFLQRLGDGSILSRTSFRSQYANPRPNKYRCVQELCSSSTFFRYFWFNFSWSSYFEFIVEKVWFGEVWFGLDRRFGPTLLCFGWVWFGCSTDKQTNNNYLILINSICVWLFHRQTNKLKYYLICEFVCWQDKERKKERRKKKRIGL